MLKCTYHTKEVQPMSGSTFGRNFTVTTWGESHGPCIGAVIDGCPSGLALSEEDIMPYMKRRRPGQSPFSTQRKETDQIEILSGVYQGITTGTPISIIIPNRDYKSEDYRSLQTIYRPGHADYTYDAKYGHRDPNGGGRASGRETAARVAAGAIAHKILHQFDIQISGFTRGIGPHISSAKEIQIDQIRENPLYMPPDETYPLAIQYLKECQQKGDSTGSIIECQITGLQSGLGEPVFQKLEAILSHAMMSIGGVRGFELGDGILGSSMNGQQFNDFITGKNAHSIQKETNHSGGVSGGISDGTPITFRVYLKPTPSIALTQATISQDGAPCEIQITGRHDPVLAPRVVPVVEAMAAIVIVDFLFDQTHASLKQLIHSYQSSNSKN